GVVLAFLLLAAACSSDNKDEASSGGSSDTTEAPANAPKGEPILVSQMYPKDGPTAQPEVVAGSRAAVDAINAAGGIKDPAGGENRPLKLVECNAANLQNPNAPVDCAKAAVDAGVVADVGKFGGGGNDTKAFNDAGIAMIGNNPYDANDLTMDHSFPLNGGSLAALAGTGAALQEAGAKKLAMINIDVAQSRPLPGFMKPVLEDESDLGTVVYVPTDPSADISSFIAQVVNSNPDGVAIADTSDATVKIVTQLRQAGYQGKIGFPSTVMTDKALKDLGSDAEGIVLAGLYDTVNDDSNAKIKQFVTEMDKYQKDASKSEFSLNSWLAVHLLADVLGDVKTIDAKSVAAALNNRKVDLGVSMPFALGVKDTYLPLPRIFTMSAQYQSVKDGKIVSTSGDGKYVDLNTLAK
ncbi:MAG TPA: ABC transporter substrate-binding protein, partial [Acidimicrobiales bacterium]|nr:ABC transporter substrate-binding protein [Acidimicrobiales bacterium]